MRPDGLGFSGDSGWTGEAPGKQSWRKMLGVAVPGPHLKDQTAQGQRLLLWHLDHPAAPGSLTECLSLCRKRTAATTTLSPVPSVPNTVILAFDKLLHTCHGSIWPAHPPFTMGLQLRCSFLHKWLCNSTSHRPHTADWYLGCQSSGGVYTISPNILKSRLTGQNNNSHTMTMSTKLFLLGGFLKVIFLFGLSTEISPQ